MTVQRSDRLEIFVFVQAAPRESPLRMGTLYSSRVRGSEVFSFEYTSDFLSSRDAFEIDPNLQLFSGPQYAPEGPPNFGIFLDSSPDRWGRVLMDRREAYRARREDRPVRRMMESDYLLGVHDESRMGALRFSTSPDGPFLDHDSEFTTPPMTSLRELERAATEIDADPSYGNDEAYQRVELLVAPGSSLGGARPKAGVRSETGDLWIAKFPGGKDEFDVGAWEYVVYELALRSGIRMSESRVEAFLSSRRTFLTRRFDRDPNGRRIHFFSAMTLLGYQDGTDSSDGVSYLELAELIVSNGAEVQSDLEQLWRRIVFNILVSNTDDHLRNHGFMLKEGGIELSPAFDINPNPKGNGLTLNVNEYDHRLDPDLALEVAPHFRLTENRAKEILGEIQEAVSGWRELAASIDIRRGEIERMAPAFRTM
ncbi:MAG: type II toxin-antitoxin system HipA family toxin [Bacteroidota bacterium]